MTKNMTLVPTTLTNALVTATYRANTNDVFARDLTDRFNEPAFYTKTKRGLAKAWANVAANFTDRTTHNDLMRMFSDAGVRYHYWCMMD